MKATINQYVFINCASTQKLDNVINHLLSLEIMYPIVTRQYFIS